MASKSRTTKKTAAPPAKRDNVKPGTPPRINLRPKGLRLGRDAKILRDLLLRYGLQRYLALELAEQFEMTDRCAEPLGKLGDVKYRQMVKEGIPPYDASDIAVSMQNAMDAAMARFRARHPGAPRRRAKPK